jgi:hypothetical protein
VGRPREPLHSKWQAYKRNQRERPKPTCSVAGCTAKADWHHRNGEPLDNRASNKVALCRSHHTGYHNRKG